ncbi:YhdP family protein [Polynucleobacter sp. JS-Polo-80-F4]|uniref:YhdP family protein n=1 Tax=Polynucleobacter sp. JS-Polo-80-F4 TaxID=2576918 RepID=UPI001C0D4B00|nr:YhdP family protein [Polynucleobacter sp. JS-Polo-80-F4]MBU3616129.1 TIGR02099 family protein [Polynucleobacter sp. JS-Polo-80-F4]
MLQKFIPPRLKSVLAKRPQGSSGAWRKRALILAGVVATLFVLGHVGVRFVLWPQIEKSKASVEKLISARIGADVSMDSLQVSWTGIRPNFEIEGLRFNNPDKSQPLLFVQKINGQLSWASFYHLAPFFHELNIENAEIYTQRNKKGVITIAGISVDGNSNDYSAENWLFAQNEIRISNVKILWDDRLQKKAVTTIDIQSLSLSNGIRSHQGSVSAATPWTKGPLTLDIDLVHHIGGQAGNWRDWIGTISWNLNELQLSQIASDFSLPLNALEGILNSNGKLKIDNGKPDGGEIYLAADNFTIQLSKDEDAIALGRLETSLIQENDGGLIAVTTKNFAWRDSDSPKSSPLENLSPMTFRWRPPAGDGEIKEFGFSSPKILVEDIALFALNLPLSKKVHQWIKASKADGELQDLDINWSESKSPLSALNIPGGWFKSNKLDFTVSGKLIDLSFVGINKSMPSVKKLSGFLTADQNKGSFSVKSNNLELEVNDLLVDPKITLDQANGQISWSKQKGNWVITAKQLALSNPDISTTLNLNYIVGEAKKPDYMTLDMDFAQANLKTAYRYLPVGMGGDVKTYVSKAFDAGVIQKGSLHIQGDPNAVPFPVVGAGEFTLNLPITGATFSPAPTASPALGVWSALNKVNGVLKMQNAKFTVDIDQASYKQVVLSKFHAEIPSVSAKQLLLTVDGEVQGDAPQLLEYLFLSPVGKKQVDLEKNLKVTGPTNLSLGLKIPLSGNGDTNSDIQLSFPGNRIQWADLPPFENLKGKMRITEVNPEFENITANFLGGDINISSIGSNQGNQSYNISGDISANFIKNYFAKDTDVQAFPILQAMGGVAKYDGTISFNKGNSDTNLKIDMRNWSSSAPVPVKKQNGTPMSGQLNLKTFAKTKTSSSRLSWDGKIGDAYFIQGEIASDDTLRHAVGIGTPAITPQQGFQLNLLSNELNLDIWQEFLSQQNINKSAHNSASHNAKNIQVSAQVKQLTLFDRVWQDLNLAAANKNSAWQLRLRGSPQIAGNIQYQPGNQSQADLISGRLVRLKVPEVVIAPPPPPTKQAQKTPAIKNSLEPGSIPNLDLTIDDFDWDKAQLGQLKIKTTTSGNALNIDSIQFSSPQGSSKITGRWVGSTPNSSTHTNLNVDLDIKDAGQIIGHWTNQKSVEGGQGKLIVNADWDGSPFNPKYDTLAGKVNLNLEKGRLLEVNTNGAKLLDVLSLQSLFRFATFDLKGSLGDIVAKGTPFNTIDASFEMNAGVAQTKQFTMGLDQARVAMSGQINIPKQTQDLRVTIFPTIDATAGSLAAFVINPIVGLGALVGQYLITSQINRNFQSDYLIQGSWDNPEVIPLDQKGQPIDSKTIDTIRSKDLLKEQAKPSINSTNPQSNPNNSTSPIKNPN